MKLSDQIIAKSIMILHISARMKNQLLFKKPMANLTNSKGIVTIGNKLRKILHHPKIINKLNRCSQCFNH